MQLPSHYSLPHNRKGFVAKRSPFGSAYALFHNGYFFGEISLCDVGDMGVWVFVASDDQVMAYADRFGLSGDMTPDEMLPIIRRAFEAVDAEYKAEAAAERASEEAAERAYWISYDKEAQEAGFPW